MELIENLPFEPEIETGTEKITSEWQLILKDFLDELNKGRGEGTQWKEYTASRVAGMMSRAGIKKGGYRNFLVDCKKAKNFSAFFHWRLKQIKNNK